MEQNTILLPVFALIFLTFFIAIWLGKLRFSVVRNGELNPAYYKLNRGGKVPEGMAKVSQNYDNLLELPILFYILIIMLFLTSEVEIAQVIMAWIFVGSRYLHSYIHTTFNNVRVRGRTFIFGVLVVFIMWVLFFVRIIQT